MVAALGLLLNLLAGHRDFAGWVYGNPNSQRNLKLLIGGCIVGAIAIELWRHYILGGPKGDPARPEDLTAYRKFLIELKCNALQLAVMHTSAQVIDHKVVLWAIFVPQSAREFAPIPEIPPEIQRRLRDEGHLSKLSDDWELTEHRKRFESSVVRPALETLDCNRLVVVVGDPGSGKSSLLKYRALQWAKDEIGPLPLFVELSSYARDARKGLLNYFLSGVEVPRFGSANLRERLQTGRAAFYLDGLDEIFDLPTRKSVIDQIVTLCATYPKAGIVVTTRKVGYEPECLRNAGFLHATLEEFDYPQILQFLRQWYLISEADDQKRALLEARLENALAASPPIRELAANPLLLTIMATLNRSHDPEKELPQNRVELYQEASRVLLQEWDTKRALLPDATLAWQEKERLLQELAGDMQQTEGGLTGNLIHRDRLLSLLRAFLDKLCITDSYSKSLALIQQLTERNFILAYAGADHFCFVHRTFLEYFCAAWFVKRLGYRPDCKLYLSFKTLREDVFGRHWKDEKWHEVLRLIVGMIPETKAGELIRFLMAQDGRNEKLANLMLAAGCLNEVRNRGAIQDTDRFLLQRIIEVAVSFDPPYHVESWEEFEECGPTRQAAVHWVALAWKNEDTLAWLRSAAAQNRDWIVRAAAVQELARGWRGAPGTLTLIHDCALNDEDRHVRRAAVRELARGWRNDPRTLHLLQDRAYSDDDPGVQQAIVQELARGWKDDPAMLPWLQDAASNDNGEDWAVRQAAVEELAFGWRNDPSILPWLQDLARSDESSAVRKEAIQGLVRRWKDDPGTLPLLQNCARNNDHESCQEVAIQELARGWRNHPSTLPLLRDRACNDIYFAVRVIAVQELAHGWRDDPDTMPWLQERVHNDKDSSVQRAAVQELACGWKDYPATLPWLQDRVRNDESWPVRQAALQELARGWKDDPGTMPLLQERARIDIEGNVRYVALEELAHGWRNDSGTLPLLQDHGRNDGCWAVRKRAVQELARGWKDDPGTLPLVLDQVHKDKDEYTRAAAISVLARGWRSDPGTLPLLHDIAYNDQSNFAREAAVKELAAGWSNDPDTLPLLQDRARNDDDLTVRKTAVQELARGWRDDPGTLPLLQDRARNDEDLNVRYAAMEELARRWRNDSGTLLLLQDRARNDRWLCQRAIQHLAQDWRNDPGTLPLLQDCARSDEEEGLQEAAVEELAHGWREDPDVTAFLRTLNKAPHV